jgi:hypothetical protein
MKADESAIAANCPHFSAIMRTPLLRFSVSAICLAAALPLPALAQQTQTPPPPPQLERLDEGNDPGITIRKDDGQHSKVTEKKEGGRVTEIKVQSGKSTYYLKPNEQAGNAQPGDAQSNTNRPAQWKVLEFDLGTVPQSTESSGTQAEPPPAKK